MKQLTKSFYDGSESPILHNSNLFQAIQISIHAIQNSFHATRNSFHATLNSFCSIKIFSFWSLLLFSSVINLLQRLAFVCTFHNVQTRGKKVMKLLLILYFNRSNLYDNSTPPPTLTVGWFISCFDGTCKSSLKFQD